MKNISFISISLIFCLMAFQVSCNNNNESKPENGRQINPSKEDITIQGSILQVDGGIMVLTQNGSLKTVPVILIPANDTVRDSLKAYYNKGIEDHYQSTRKAWVKVSGNFLSEDTVRSLFKFSWVQFLDEEEALKEQEEIKE